MKPCDIVEKARRIKGVKQIEFCPIKDRNLIAFIIRDEKDDRYGSALFAKEHRGDVWIPEKEALAFLKNIKKLINGPAH